MATRGKVLTLPRLVLHTCPVAGLRDRRFEVHPQYRPTLHTLLLLIVIVGTLRVFNGGPLLGGVDDIDHRAEANGRRSGNWRGHEQSDPHFATDGRASRRRDSAGVGDDWRGTRSDGYRSEADAPGHRGRDAGTGPHATEYGDQRGDRARAAPPASGWGSWSLMPGSLPGAYVGVCHVGQCAE